MKWAYGVTTVPARIEDLLPRTLASLARAGFARPRLFVDGVQHAESYAHFDLPVTTRWPRLRVAGNWVLTLWELYLREPVADRYAVFQDDVVASAGLREYLEACKYPARGYWNLWTYPPNESRDGSTGWHLSNQKGYGALGLVFGREAVTTLLSQARFIRRPQRLDRGWKLIDGGIIDCLRPIGWREWVHTPSLLEHTGRQSTFAGTRTVKSRSWRGEAFDCRTLVGGLQSPIPNPQSPVARPSPLAPRPSPARIGLAGYDSPSGLGEVNRQLARWLPADEWLVIPRGRQGPGRAELEAWVRSVDVVVFAETPLPPALAEVARRLGRRIVCVPMLEWLPTSGWVRLVDLFLCPTRQCYQAIRGRLPAVEFPWPVDVERFAFRPRTRCGRFLFVEGRGGWQGRKGAAVVRAALGHWPGMPLVVRSQRPGAWPPGVEVLGPVADNRTLYEAGDVLLAPHSVDGIGLEPMEAMATGMPVVTTAGPPWDEIPAVDRIPAAVRSRMIRRRMPWHLPDPAALARIARELVGQDLSAASQEARAWAESRAWAGAADALRKLILGS